MSTSGKNVTYLTNYICNLRGGSQPILARANDNQVYVVKFANNLQGANLLFNESMGSELYQACRLAVPSWKPLMVTDSFLDQNPTSWMLTSDGCRRPRSGLCFGSRFLGGEGVRLFEFLPRTSFKLVCKHNDFWLAWMIDICAQHSDNRQVIFQQRSDGKLDGFFFDHGHLFGGPNGEHQPHFLASRYLDRRIYRNVYSHNLEHFQAVASRLNTDRLWKQAQALPDDWKTVSALSNFAQCLDKLTCARLLQNVLNAMVYALEHRTGPNHRNSPDENERPDTVLRPEISTARLGTRCRVRHDACALACP